MTTRIIRILPGNRFTAQGLSNIGGGRFTTVQPNAEVLTYKLDFERWLDTATIASSTVTATGATVINVESSTYLTLTISAVSIGAVIDVTAVATDGRAKAISIGIGEGRSALPPAYITSPDSESQRIGYDNTDSNLTATNVQEAIDELEAETPTITVSTDDPSGGENGDVWLKVAI